MRPLDLRPQPGQAGRVAWRDRAEAWVPSARQRRVDLWRLWGRSRRWPASWRTGAESWGGTPAGAPGAGRASPRFDRVPTRRDFSRGPRAGSGCYAPGCMADSENAHTAYPADVYETFDAFMQQVIKDTYEHGAKRAEFVALVIASGELLPMAWGRLRKSGVRELAVGAAGVVALRVGL